MLVILSLLVLFCLLGYFTLGFVSLARATLFFDLHRCRSPFVVFVFRLLSLFVLSEMVLAAELPQISISLAPPQETIAEPVSPFSWPKLVTINDNDDAFRPIHLTPPPTHLKFSSNLPSPLGRAETQTKGLEPERFEALLKASRERNAYSGGKKDGGLRKEIALKAHKNKQGLCFLYSL